MTMTFPYIPFARNHPVVSLSGRFSRPRPVINVTLIGPARSMVVQALLDTGSDDTVFHDSVASSLGVSLQRATLGAAQAISGNPVSLRYALLTLRIADNYERREWTTLVGFAPLPGRLPVLGFAGFLQYFTASFHGDLEFVELTTNSLYPAPEAPTR